MKARCALAILVVVGLPLLTAGSAAARRKYTIEFRPVLGMVAPEALVPTTTAPVDLAAVEATVASCDLTAVAHLSSAPTTDVADASPDECVIYPFRTGGRTADRYYLGRAAAAVAKGIDDAFPQFRPGQGWVVKIDFGDRGSKAWDRLAQEQFHHQVAMTLQGYVVSVPTIQPNDQRFTSFDGVAVVSGDFGKKEATALAAAARLANRR